jgi:hypothetical protein
MNGPVRGRPRARTKDAGRIRLVQIGLKPLALNADEAAAICSLSPQQFLLEVKAGNLPAPLCGLLSKRKLWSVHALERAINGHGDETPAVGDDTLMREIKSRATRAA